MSTPRTATEWNDLWKAKQQERVIDHDASYWNKRSGSFGHKDTPGSYTARFLELADIKQGESVFDMGAGTGNLSVPLAREGHTVLAADFSTGMLVHLHAYAQSAGVGAIATEVLSWEDNWQDHGIEPKSFDVCLASRSIATDDLMSALIKLTSVAKRRVCITLATGSSPRMHDEMLRAIGLDPKPCFDTVFAIGILFGLGYLPHLTYIETDRHDRFLTEQAAFDKYFAMAQLAATQTGANVSDEALSARVEAWLKENLQAVSDGEEDAFELKTPRGMPWAFIWWDAQATDQASLQRSAETR